MYFKQIDVAGFKSFADRLEINFDSGITAIVGPNGCGKSNVADAIRWVLGEQSSKLLRGSSMQDVIFNGTEKRKSLSYAEVTLLFNNNDRFFSFDCDELAITRKLYRSGDSEYLLNRVPCRLKDIINLLHDSGIGRDGYSIIGQGKVEEIISSKPENRRGIFEEAAGISKFKSKKIDSERKLERVRDNLMRLKDITSEIERQLEPLKKQSETAKKYLTFRDELKDLETNIYLYQFENASELKKKINLKLNALSEELENRQNDLDEATLNYNNAMNDINNIDKLIESLHEEILQLTVGIEKQAGEVKVIKERINILTEQNDKINLDLLNSKNNKIRLEQLTEQKKYEHKETTQIILSLNKELSILNDRYLTIVDELTLSEDEAETSQKEMINTLDKITNIKTRSSRLQAEKQSLEENIKDLINKISSLSEKINTHESQKFQTQKAINNARIQKNEFEKKCDDINLEINILSKTIKDIENEISSLFAKIQVYENRHKFLVDMQAEYEGFAGSVKKLLKESDKNKELKSKMIGVLASLIKVPEKFETAIEMAMGNAVQNIVTYNEQNAKDLIYFLKQNQFGRATFMPVTTMKPRSISEIEKKTLKLEGVFGIAAELISYDRLIDNVIKNILGSTVIVSDLNVATKLAGLNNFSFKIVTLDGDIINPQGSYTGGSKKSETVNLISREREITSLFEDVKNFKLDIEEKQKMISELNLKLGKLNNDLTQSNKNKTETEIWFAKETEKLDNIDFTVYTLNEEIEQLNRTKQQVESKLKFITEELQSIDTLENTESINRKKVNESIESRQQKFSDLRIERDELVTKLTEIKVSVSQKQSVVLGIETDLERIAYEIEEETVLQQDLVRDLRRNEQTIEGANDIITKQIEKETSLEARERLKELKDKQLGLDSTKVELQQKVKELDVNKTEFITIISTLSEKKHNEEMKLAKVDTDIETMQERIFEEYELTYETCLEFRRTDFEINRAMIDLNKTKKEITKLGYVNINAIEDFKNLDERYTGLMLQIEDLEKSENDLTKIIKELSNEMITRFETEFNKINHNFKNTFKELFGGGNAKLELIDSDNLLEAGIEIIAEPPGKKLQNISLLSGGEKALTAIAILFAILKLRPMPFCVLDEIEAALDDSNVDRFAQYLKRFSKDTQFIVITHRKPTMELADTLYGVTMEEKGVSKIVSVKLSEAVKNVKVS